ncbi:uncharacterized protein LOC6033400 [Culex quinquefasciatus]|uniref:uncharacterized protein LOC6033400 n=1 Tax=Culex quinquefasciatus TaxID=7176 RepID=UPI0018E36BCE|nr:uncharacterized protein LOC6033400 [Culex quinquefasciatus]
MRAEIRKYDGTPTIVIYYRSLFEPLNQRDWAGTLCGGRYELAFQIMDRFLKRLTQLGAKLVFFGTGPSRRADRITKDSNRKYHEYWLKIVDLVDKGTEIDKICKGHIPDNTNYPVKLLAKRYGQFRVPTEGDCKKEMVAYAQSVGALAIISNNSDFMIFEGSWRFWCSKRIDFEKLTAEEFDRSAVRQHLGLQTIQQMAILSTLASGNVFLRSEETFSFLAGHSNSPEGKLGSVAEFVRRPHDDVLVDIFGLAANAGDLRERFQKGLDFYGTEGSLSDGLDLNLFKEQDFHKMWTGFPIEIIDCRVELRHDGPSYLTLSIRLLLRAAAIIGYHRQPKHTDHEFLLFKKHDSDYTEEIHPLTFPQHVVPPTLEAMFSEDPATRVNLADTKLQLYSWIISDSLDHRQLASIPPKLMPTVAAIYLLAEAQLIDLFEADLLLEVAYQIAFQAYDMFRIRYPKRLDPRAFRVALFYATICRYTTKALTAVGLDTCQYPGYPLFDGVLFHNLYRKWARGLGEIETIEQWRIYADIFVEP